jgi:hypothetical protein
MVDSIPGLRPDGRLVTMGADAEPLSISLVDLISKRIRIIGSQQNGPEYLYEALDFVAQGKVKTIVETYPLAEAQKAYERVAEGKARFRAVLNVIAHQSGLRRFRADCGLLFPFQMWKSFRRSARDLASCQNVVLATLR